MTSPLSSFHFHKRAAIIVLASVELLCFLPHALQGADAWGGFIDASATLNTSRYSFGPARPDMNNSNQNYYDGDFADFDGDGLIVNAGVKSRHFSGVPAAKKPE